MFTIVFLILAIIGSIIHILLLHTPILSTALLYLLIFCVGFQGVYGYLGHFFKSDEIAEYIGWPKGNLFQKEVAYTNLALGVLGILCIWVRGNFWLATIIGQSIFLLGAAHVHIIDRIKTNNLHPGNAGPVFYMEIGRASCRERV